LIFISPQIILFGMVSKGEIIDLLVDKIKELPPMPSNVVKLRQAVADPNVNFSRLTPILKEDPSMCADVLKIANSARYGVGHKVDLIEEAVRYFGIHSLIDFVSIACSEKIIKKSFSHVANLNDYLDHSRQVSLACSVMTKALKLNAHRQEVFTIIGLLHDIGRLVILLVTEESFILQEIFNCSWEEMQEIVKDENKLFGINHGELGMRICQKWLFPEVICKGIHKHHSPLIGKDDFSFEGTVIFLSEVISFTELPENVLEKALPPVIMEKLGLTTTTLIEARHSYLNEINSES